MSEFNFDYKCMFMMNGDAEKNDKVLQFKLFADRINHGKNLAIQVYIPEKLRQDVAGVRVYFEQNAIDFPQIEKLMEGSYQSCIEGQGSASSLLTDSCIYITSGDNNLSGTGLIGLVMKDQQNPESSLPEVQNIYKFVTNFEKKNLILYNIIENKNGLKVQIFYPKLFKKLNLNILSKSGSKPLLYGDNTPENLLKDKNDKPFVITLKPANKQLNTFEKVFKTNKTSNFDFRLVFEDLNDNDFYLLQDESEDTLEDRKIKKENKTSSNVVKRKAEHKCPFCGGPLVKPISKEPGIYSCKGEYIAPPLIDGKQTFVCKEIFDQFNVDNVQNENFYNEHVDIEYLELPDNAFDVPGMNVAFVGLPESGKTMFISSVVNVGFVKGSIDSYQTSSSVFKSIISTFDKDAKNSNPVETEILTRSIYIETQDYYRSRIAEIENKLKETKKQMFEEQLKDLKNKLRNFGPDNEYRISSGNEYQKYKTTLTSERYVLTVGRSVERQTKEGVVKKLAFNPMGFTLNKLGNIYFYDVPGECFYKHTKMRTFDVADCIIAIIDGGKDSSQPLTNLASALGDLPNLCTSSETAKRIKDLPIAVVYTKLDLKLAENVDSNDKEALKRCFDDNCNICRENMQDFLPKNGKYHNSELEDHINCSSYEIEHYLRSLNTTEGNSLDTILKDYHNVKFFACSSLGGNNCLDLSSGKSEKARVLFKPKTIRVELPLIWLMYQKGLIRR